MLRRSNQTSSLAPLLASTVVKLGAAGLSDCGFVLFGGRAPRDFHHAGIVDAERARGVGQGQLGVRAGDKGPGWREPDRAHVLGEIGGERHERTSIAASLLVGRKKDR